MAHLKLDLLLTETGYKPTRDQRFRVYLTNSLEEHHPDTGSLFATALANEANYIKRDTPVMVVMGNPPYSVSSTNKSAWIEKLVADYKKDLNERNIQPLSDDYIKFIRFGQHFIDKNGEGILAYISNNSFIDGLIHRQMRKHLLESFDKIYILDLHGNAKKKETAQDGSPDQNVFDIMQGVSINIFVKKGVKVKNKLAEVFASSLKGKREHKYNLLSSAMIENVKWNKLRPENPNFFFIEKSAQNSESYEEGFSIGELFSFYNVGLATEFDELVVKDSAILASELLKDLINEPFEHILKKYNLQEKKKEKIIRAKKDAQTSRPIITTVNYRPFDDRYTIYTGNSNGIMGRPRNSIMHHLLKDNLALICCRQQSSFDFQHVFITSTLSEGNSISLQTKERSYIFPLYQYPENLGQTYLETKAERSPNFNEVILKQIITLTGLTFIPEKETTSKVCFEANPEVRSEFSQTFTSIDLLDYIYAVLHSPTYREKYKEFLKIDFPRVPYPTNAETFWQLAELGGQLRQIHLLESPVVDDYITQYPIDGNNSVDKIQFEENYEILEGDTVTLINTRYEMGRVYINETQFFQMVPKIAWEFYIGGYQPAQKWLKDRKGRELSFEDILHYQKIIVALAKTDRLMKEIDKVEIVISSIENEAF